MPTWSAAAALTSKVRMVGQVLASEIPGWLSRSDVGILPMRRDVLLDFAFPNKLPEFIIIGKPVIVSRLKAIRHYFSEDALAYSEPNDPADLARQMVRVYRDRELRRLLATRAAGGIRADPLGRHEGTIPVPGRRAVSREDGQGPLPLRWRASAHVAA